MKIKRETEIKTVWINYDTTSNKYTKRGIEKNMETERKREPETEGDNSNTANLERETQRRRQKNTLVSKRERKQAHEHETPGVVFYLLQFNLSH